MIPTILHTHLSSAAQDICLHLFLYAHRMHKHSLVSAHAAFSSHMDNCAAFVLLVLSPYIYCPVNEIVCVCAHFVCLRLCVCVRRNEVLHPLKRSVIATNGLSSHSASSPLLPPGISSVAQSAVPSHLIPAPFSSGKYWRNEITPGALRGKQEGSAPKSPRLTFIQ